MFLSEHDSGNLPARAHVAVCVRESRYFWAIVSECQCKHLCFAAFPENSIKPKVVVATHCYFIICSIKRGACFIPDLTHFRGFGRDVFTKPLPACPTTCLVGRPPTHPALSRLVCSCLQDAPLYKSFPFENQKGHFAQAASVSPAHTDQLGYRGS